MLHVYLTKIQIYISFGKNLQFIHIYYLVSNRLMPIPDKTTPSQPFSHLFPQQCGWIISPFVSWSAPGCRPVLLLTAGDWMCGIYT